MKQPEYDPIETMAEKCLNNERSIRELYSCFFILKPKVEHIDYEMELIKEKLFYIKLYSTIGLIVSFVNFGILLRYIL